MAKDLSYLLLALVVAAPSAYCADYSCVTLEYSPLSFTSLDGRISGFAADLVRTTFSRMGKTVDIGIYPWARAYELAHHGAVDCIFTIARSDFRTQFLDFSTEPLVVQPMHLYRRSDARGSSSINLSELKGFRIGTVRQGYYGTAFEALRPMLLIDESSSYHQAFQKLAAGRVDFVPSSVYVADAVLASIDMKEKQSRITRMDPPIDQVPTYVAFSKSRNSAGLRDMFDRELRKFMASPEFSALQVRYRLNPNMFDRTKPVRRAKPAVQRP